MKKYLFSLILLLISYVGFSQKGLSYQAVILDPNPIEAPGLDISGQPYVNGEVWIKFIIYGSTLQYEEVHKTKTDAYGLVNLMIGSVSAASFNSLVWDSSQKTLQVHISFDQGSSFTKVSDQKLTYNPYALFAETASKLGGTLPVSGGGTGATTLAAARINLGLDKVDNTPDAQKPVSAATQAALDLKVNTADLTAALASKADTAVIKSYVDSKLASGNFSSTQTTTATITDADATTKGKIQLAGDLSGTAASPAIATGAVTTLKIGDGAVTDVKIATLSGSKVTGNITGNAANVTGTIALSNGGTAATTAAGARVNLGLVIGTDVLAQRTFGTAANSAASDFVAATEKGSYNGVATLGNDGKIPSTQIPAISFQSASVVANQTAMLAINGAVVGSIAIRTDNNKNYVLSIAPATDINNWVELATPNSVTSVNSFAGPNVVLTTNEVSEGATNKYYTDARARGAISASGPLSFNATSGVISLSASSASSDGYLSSADFTRFNNKQSALTAGTDYVTPAQISLASLGAEASANKSTATDLGNTNPSDVLYPSQKAIKTYVDQQSANAGVADNSISSAKINGSIAINRGGTGATNAADARANLGLTIGTNVQAPLIAGTDYLAPNGSAASLTNFPILNQNTAGNAATATIATTVSGIVAGINGGTGVSNSGKTITLGGNFQTTGNAITLTTTAATNVTLPTSGTLATVAQLDAKELISNKSTDITLGATNNPTSIGDTKFPTQNAVKAYVTSALATGASSIVGYTTALQTNGNNAGTNNVGIGPSTVSGIDGGGNTSVGSMAMQSNTTGWYNTAIGFRAMAFISTSGSNDNVAIGNAAAYYRGSGWDVNNQQLRESIYIGSMSRASANNQRNEIVIGYNAIGNGSNTIQLGNTSITDVKTNGKLTTGAVSYPITHGSSGQMLSTTGSGDLIWTGAIKAAGGSTYNAAVGHSFIGGDWARNTGMFSDNPDGGGAATLKFRIATSNSTADPYLEISPSKVSVFPTTASTSKTTGALTVAGGLGVNGDIYANKLILNSGTAGGASLEVNGASTNTVAFNGGSATSIDFTKSNLAYTTASAGNFTLTGMKDGGAYTLAVQGASSGTAAFSQAGFTFKSINNAATTASKHTLYTFIVMGTNVYYSMVTGL